MQLIEKNNCNNIKFKNKSILIICDSNNTDSTLIMKLETIKDNNKFLNVQM